MNENYFISPKYDFAFKRLFGTKKNEDLLRSFLKASTDLDDSELSDIEFIDPHLNARYNDDKAGTLDVRVKTKENTHIDIEIQICKHNGFKERLTYYVSRMVSDSIRSGEEFGIMSKSIVIAICDFVLFTETSEFKNNFYFMEEQEHFKLTDICKIITLELPKVPKTNDTNKLIQ